MTPGKERFWRERAELAYLDALEAGDIDAVAELWEQASGDPELEQALEEIGQGLLEEMGPSPNWKADSSEIIAMLERHLATRAVSTPQPLTADDVARRIAADLTLAQQLSDEDRKTNDALMSNQTPLPSQLGMQAMQRWTETLSAPASAGYWRIFRQVAVLLSMGRSQQEGMLAAARKSGTPPTNPDKGKR